MYRITVYPEAADQIDALPLEVVADCANVLDVLEVQPWAGRPQYDGNPDGAVRLWPFGPGMAGHVVYLILEDQREVHVLLVQWFG